MAETLDLRPDIVNVKVYEGDAWAAEVGLTEPGTTMPMDLTTAVIEATLRPKEGNADGTDDIPLVITPGVLADGEFFYGQTEVTVGGKYDVQVTINGAPRTYIRGSISVTAPDITPE